MYTLRSLAQLLLWGVVLVFSHVVRLPSHKC